MYHFHANWLYFFFHLKIIFVSLFIFNGFLFIFCYISSLNLATDHICLKGSNMIFSHIFTNIVFMDLKSIQNWNSHFVEFPYINNLSAYFSDCVFFDLLNQNSRVSLRNHVYNLNFDNASCIRTESIKQNQMILNMVCGANGTSNV